MTDQLRSEISAAIALVVRRAAEHGSRPNDRCYLRLRPNGTVDISYETSYCISSDEYSGRVPHTLSLEISQETRDYTHVSHIDADEDACAEAEELLAAWAAEIEEWIAAGNFQAN